jgi:hypothetical protein
MRLSWLKKINNFIDIDTIPPSYHPNNTLKSPKRILVLRIFNSTNEYEEMRNIHIKNDNSIFVTYNPHLQRDWEFHSDIRTIELRGEESFIPGILNKTIRAIEICLELFEFDILVRSNMSTVIDIGNLNNIVDKLDHEIITGGHISILTWRDPSAGIIDDSMFEMPFISGTSITMSRHFCNYLVKNSESLDRSLLDDISIAKFIRENKSPINFESSLVVNEVGDFGRCFYRYNREQSDGDKTQDIIDMMKQYELIPQKSNITSLRISMYKIQSFFESESVVNIISSQKSNTNSIVNYDSKKYYIDDGLPSKSFLIDTRFIPKESILEVLNRALQTFENKICIRLTNSEYIEKSETLLKMIDSSVDIYVENVEENGELVTYIYINKKWLVFYTVFCGLSNNTANKCFDAPSKIYKCYYFTSNPDTYNSILANPKGWDPVFITQPHEHTDINCSFFSKYLKCLPHKNHLLSNYTYSCYIDSKIHNVSHDVVLENIYNMERKGLSTLMRQHLFLRSGRVMDEFNESMKQTRYKFLKTLMLDYIKRKTEQGFTLETPNDHYQTGFIIRDMCKSYELSNDWYNNVRECGIQCQISFFFVKQTYRSEIGNIDGNITL